MRTATLRPGLLVALKTSVDGGVNYNRVDLDIERTAADGAAQSRWETTRRIEDPEEFERALKVRSKARSLITGACAPSDFGLLCPESNEEKLNDAVREAVGLADVHNATAARSFVRVFVMKGRIAADDAEAIRAINFEVRGLLDTMNAGIGAADPDAIRSAANRARQIGAMLAPEAAGKVNAAIEQARDAARAIVRRVVKGGEVAAGVVAELKADAIATARFTFLDMDDGAAVSEPEVTAPVLDAASVTPAIEPAAYETEAPAPAAAGPIPDLEVC